MIVYEPTVGEGAGVGAGVRGVDVSLTVTVTPGDAGSPPLHPAQSIATAAPTMPRAIKIFALDHIGFPFVRSLMVPRTTRRVNPRIIGSVVRSCDAWGVQRARHRLHRSGHAYGNANQQTMIPRAAANFEPQHAGFRRRELGIEGLSHADDLFRGTFRASRGG